MTIWITTNGRPSNGAKALSQQPGFKRCITGKGLKYDDVLVNWGSSQDIHTVKDCGRAMNFAQNVGFAANKLTAFQLMTDAKVKTVDWTALEERVLQWCLDGCTVVVRNKLTGHSGDGIFILEPDKCATLLDVQNYKAPLYTKYIFKEKEFRVHVVGDNVIDTQRKIRDPEREVITWKVRSHQNGFIYTRNNVKSCNVRDELATAAIHALDLDFGAVDIIQDKEGIYYVLEVNTAPGLEGQTIERYAEAFRNWADEHE